MCVCVCVCYGHEFTTGFRKLWIRCFNNCDVCPEKTKKHWKCKLTVNYSTHQRGNDGVRGL